MEYLKRKGSKLKRYFKSFKNNKKVIDGCTIEIVYLSDMKNVWETSERSTAPAPDFNQFSDGFSKHTFFNPNSSTGVDLETNADHNNENLDNAFDQFSQTIDDMCSSEPEDDPVTKPKPKTKN